MRKKKKRRTSTLRRELNLSAQKFGFYFCQEFVIDWKNATGYFVSDLIKSDQLPTPNWSLRCSTRVYPVTTNELTCDLNPGEVDHSEAPNRVLLGKLYLFSRLGRKAIQGSLNNAWSSLVGWSWKEREDGLLQFTFQSSWDADNVLLRRPWLVCGHLLVLMPWPSWLTPSEVVFDQTPLWVRLKSIPPFYWNKTNLQELAGKVSASYELPRHIEKISKEGPSAWALCDSEPLST
ncbi:hypothetical protein F8388_011050 [Cannabis sativa]|uniref:DUF4283 domain-containing protein n=1 Tax=Cannabis sativa TaxID=3483 RepID=A0A7J6FQP1_CANSA|nr:hypothetical protein F8388_011050 [Cannabis sativa]